MVHISCYVRLQAYCTNSTVSHKYWKYFRRVEITQDSSEQLSVPPCSQKYVGCRKDTSAHTCCGHVFLGCPKLQERMN